MVKPRTDLEGSWVEGEAISVDEHPQGCQGDEEPAAEGGKVDELVDLSSHQRQHHQRVLETEYGERRQIYSFFKLTQRLFLLHSFVCHFYENQGQSGLEAMTGSYSLVQIK